MISLSSRGLSGAKALVCCQREALSFELYLRSILSQALAEVLELRTQGDFSQSLVLLPLTKNLPRIIRVSRGRPLPVGAVIIFASAALGSIVAQTATLEALDGLVKIVGLLLDVRKSGCEICIRASLWGQRAPQKPFCSRLMGRRRGGKTIRVIYRKRIRKLARVKRGAKKSPARNGSASLRSVLK